MVKRALARADTLRVRLEAPIVAASFGEQGTGKSSLINAIIGEECTPSGRERPTTRRPIVIAHFQDRSRTDRAAAGRGRRRPPRRRDSQGPRSHRLAPDPDTSENEATGSNLQRLHALLPYLRRPDLHIDTAEVPLGPRGRGTRAGSGRLPTGLRSGRTPNSMKTFAKTGEPGCANTTRSPTCSSSTRCADCREQQASQRPSGDLARLQDLLTTQLAASERMRVRRANVVDLLLGVFSRCRELLRDEGPRLDELEQGLSVQNAALTESLSRTLREELISSRHLWERRLLAAVTASWGFSPFSGLLRMYQGLERWSLRLPCFDRAAPHRWHWSARCRAHDGGRVAATRSRRKGNTSQRFVSTMRPCEKRGS